MALTFDVSRMKNFEVLTTLVVTEGDSTRQRWHYITEGLIFLTMGIGMNEITEENWKEFYNRVNMWERCNGPQLWRGHETNSPKNFITPLEVFMHIGLHTNASRKTEAQFTKDCFACIKDETARKTHGVEEQYMLSGLETMDKEHFQRFFEVESFEDNDTLDNLIRRHLKRKEQPSSAYHGEAKQEA
jgi:hypothetical protein